MKRVLIVYFSAGGTTQQMARYIAEGVRFTDQEAVVKRESDVDSPEQIADFSGYIFGSPTYSLEIPEQMDMFISMMENTGTEDKLGGAFGPYTHEVSYQHDSLAPAKVFEKMQKLLRIIPFELGPLTLQEDLVDTAEGIKACQDYGRAFGEKLAALTGNIS